MKDSKGFTLIELLVVITIIGILAAIAIPQFQRYRQRGYDTAALTDLRTAASAEEAYFIENNSYVSCATNAACVTALNGLEGVSSTVALSLTGTTQSFTGSSYSSNGSGLTYQWDSGNGGLQ